MDEWLTCPTEVDGLLLLPGNYRWYDVLIGLGIFFVPAFTQAISLLGLFGALGLAILWFVVIRKVNGYGPPGWLLHSLYWLEIGIKPRGFHPAAAVTYDSW